MSLIVLSDEKQPQGLVLLTDEHVLDGEDDSDH